MQGSREIRKQKGCGAFCCSCRLSVSSSEDVEGSNSDRYAPISSLAHAMVQERLDQMIKERVEMRNEGRKKGRVEGTKVIVMVAMDKYSYDLREDFRESMVEMIIANRIDEPKDLRCLLNCYVSMNANEYRPIILQVFHEGSDPMFSLHNRRLLQCYMLRAPVRSWDVERSLFLNPPKH